MRGRLNCCLLILIGASLAPAADSRHWSFKPVERPEPPRVNNSAWPRNDIDRFILAKLERAGLAPSAEADPRTLIRRVYLDLLGLPPTPEEVESFLRGSSAKPQAAYETLVDRLLASPHFGERWGRHWLDLARFAESDGYENDGIRKEAWRYRDWVIDACNRDLPFDRFTIEQLAGDLLPDATEGQKIATGFHRNTLWNSAASGDKEEFRTHAIKDRTDTTGLVWMGLTLGCAKCHNHKYDPVSQKEYYQLYAFFNRTDNLDLSVRGGKAQTIATADRPTHVHKRGDFLQRGEEVSTATPDFLPPLRPRGKKSDRLDLARWLVDPAHPLTARVAANHVWQHLFGVGLVPTPDNFGTNGRPPTHPELLDWLASEFVRLRWSRKLLIKTVVMSATYRQSSQIRNAEFGMRNEVESAVMALTGTAAPIPHSEFRTPHSVDPGNVLLGRQNRVRVEAEIIRDLALSASGLLDPKLGGPSVVPPYPKELPANQFSNEAFRKPTKDYRRRGVYVHIQRTLLHPVLSSFDAADPNLACVRRERGATPIQALTLLNDPTFAECARALGERLRKAGPDRDKRLTYGFKLCIGRPPAQAELDVLRELVQAQQRTGATDEVVWAGVGRVLLNLEAFITRE